MAWSILQSNSGASATLTAAVSYSSNLSSGTKLVAYVSNAQSMTISSVKDTAGNSFSQILSNSGATGNDQFIYVLDTPAGDVGATTTVTATWTGTANGAALLIQEVSGLAAGYTAVDCMDGTAGTSCGNSNPGAFSATLGSYTSAAANELLVAFYGDDGDSGGATITTPSGYTADAHNLSSNSDNDLFVFYKNSTGGAESPSSLSANNVGTTNINWETSFVAFLLAPPPAGGQERLPPTFAPGLYTTPDTFPCPFQGDPQWHGPPVYPDSGREQQPFIPSPGLNNPAAWNNIPQPSPNQFNAMADPGFPPPVTAVPAVPPQFIDQAGYRPRWAPRISRGSFQPSLTQANQGVQFPLYMRQAGNSSRWTLRRSHGTFLNQSWGQSNQGIAFPLWTQQAQLRRVNARTVRPARGQFFNQAWGQGNQGTQFPLYLQQALRKRLTLRRSQGQFFNPGSFALSANPSLPSFPRQSAPRKLTLRRSQGTFFNQSWGQASQGVTFPLYLQQVQKKRLIAAARRTHGIFFSQEWGQGNQGTVYPYPGFTRQPEARRLALRRSQGRFFSQEWGQANQGVQFPLFIRQAQSRRLTLRRSAGQFFMQAWGQVPPPSGVTSGAEQYPQIVPPFSSPGFFWQPWVPQADPGFQPAPPPAVPSVPQFLTRQQRAPSIKARQGKYADPGWGQSNQGIRFPLWMRQPGNSSRWTLRRSHGTFFQQAWGQGNQGVVFPYPGFSRQAEARRLTLRRSQGKYFSPGQFNLIGNSYPDFTRQAQTPPRLTLRRSQGKYFDPGSFSLSANPGKPTYMRQGGNSPKWNPKLLRGHYFNPGQFNLSANPGKPTFMRQSGNSPKWNPKIIRGRRFDPYMPQVVIPVWPPEFRTTHRWIFTRLDKARRGNIIQLVPFQTPSVTAPEVVFKLGVLHFQWITGGAKTRWRVP